MKVAFDASVTLAPRTGIGRFALELLRALVRRGGRDVEFHVLLNSQRHEPRAEHSFLFESPNVRVARRRIPGSFVVRAWTAIGHPSLEWMLGSDVDVAHAPAGYIPPTAAALVATVHDLSFLRDPPESLAPLGSRMFRDTWPRQLPRAARIATDSDFVRRDLLDAIPAIDAARVSAIPLGIDHLPEPVAGKPRSYLFAVTAEEPRKRVGMLLDAYRIFASRVGENAPPLKVLGVGSDRPLPPGVERMPRVSDEELASAYAGALATVLTSREEGFGLPLLESMRVGTPVICGRNSSLAEIGGAAARFVEPESADAFAAAMESEMRGPTPQDSAALRAYARQYTWDRAADEYLRLYGEAARG